MLARRLATILPALTLPDALDTTCIHRVASRTGGRTALVTTRPCRPPTTPSPMSGGSGVARCRCQASCRGRTTACASWMHGLSANATSWKSCASRSRRVSYKYNLPRVLNLHTFTELAIRMMAVRDSGRAR
jgi:hypothetical protein